MIQLTLQVKKGKIKGSQQLQMLRSASPWSIGAKDFEQSIHNAYQTLIKESKHFIYIQNQFFMGVENKIVDCLVQRIKKAHLNKQNFKVVAVMPLLLGVAGEIQTTSNTVLRVQAHNQFQLICRGENSLHAKLSDLAKFNINDYIFFFGLRNHAVLNYKPITQIIYVHSKLMIVDDNRAIIGSANINNRSLCGQRDSQLAVVIEQNNGKLDQSKSFGTVQRENGIFNLRAQLFKEHFGLTDSETANIKSQQIWSRVINTAKSNTLIYRTLFGCYPDDTITVGEEIRQRRQQSKPELYYKLKDKIYGHAVQFPLSFMEDQNMQFHFGDTQGIILGQDGLL